MKVLILGASGIIGQHLRLCVPPGIEPTWVRRNADELHEGLDCDDWDAVKAFLDERKPEVIVNLAGESRPDEVERNPRQHRQLNARFPGFLARWCDRNKAHLVHVSTQAVFDGENPPYGSDSPTNPVNAYGLQKLEAEMRVRTHRNWTIVRPTFVLGVRPLKHVGRANPLESMLTAMHQKQVDDRWFSVAFADVVAARLWELSESGDEFSQSIIHVGSEHLSRWEIAREVAKAGAVIERVSHNSFSGIAARPKDTSYSSTRLGWRASWTRQLYKLMKDSTESRAREIALFLGITEAAALEHLNRGFLPLLSETTADLRASNPSGSDDEMLPWYRKTEAYIWELTAYHLDPGYNYMGMIGGIAERLQGAGAKRVLCLGDGIGDLTLLLAQRGFEAFYHDLALSRTQQFAAFRFWNQTGNGMNRILTHGWEPNILDGYDAIVSLDFLEHVPNVADWIKAIRYALKPGGLLCSQNAFACGSGPKGSMPMHLAVNDRYEKDWDPELFALGFTQESSNWYRTPEKAEVAA